MRYTKIQLKAWEKDWRLHNKWLRQRHMPTITFEEHIGNIHGKTVKRKRAFEPLKQTMPTTYRSTAHIPSAGKKSGGAVSTTKKDTPQYTGTYIIGIATMHKSNAVPVTNPTQATEIAQMAK